MREEELAKEAKAKSDGIKAGVGVRRVDAMQEWAKEDKVRDAFDSTSALDGTGTVNKMPSLLPDAGAASSVPTEGVGSGREMNGHLLHHGIHTWQFDLDKNDQPIAVHDSDSSPPEAIKAVTAAEAAQAKAEKADKAERLKTTVSPPLHHLESRRPPIFLI